jgi:CysZ protein
MGFLRGIAAFFAGAGWLLSTPRLWARALVPVATALVLIVALGAPGIAGARAFAHGALGGGIGAGLLGVLLAITALLLAIVVGVSLAQPLSGWALDAIVSAQERALGVELAPEPGRLTMVIPSAASALLAVATGVPLLALLTIVGWVFPPAVVVTVPIKVLATALLLAWDLLDYPLARQGLGLRERLRWCARNASSVTGFGLSAVLFFALPGLGLLALPFGVAGATRLANSRYCTRPRAVTLHTPSTRPPRP